MLAGIEYNRPKLTAYQTAAFFHDKRFAWVEGTAKAGKTMGLAAWITEQAFLRKNRNYVWLAPVFGQAEIAYTRIKNGLAGQFLSREQAVAVINAQPERVRRANETKLTLTLPTKPEHVLWFKSGEKPDNIYGEDVGAAVIDEGSRMREAAWWALRSTLTATRGPLRGIANVKGKKNWFYNKCREAEKGDDPDSHYAKITALDAIRAGILASDEIDRAKRDLPESVFNELYMAIPSDTGCNPFGIDAIAAAVDVISLAPAVCYGVDLAKSIDWTVIIGLDDEGKVCHFERFQKPWTETKARIREVCGSTPTLVDSTGVGDPVLEDIQRGGDIGMDQLRPNFEGYKFSSSSKQQLMEGLAVAIQQGRTTVLEGAHRIEMESFEYEYSRTGVTYSAPEGCHDDTVCAHAMAWARYRGSAGMKPASNWGGTTTRGPAPEWA